MSRTTSFMLSAELERFVRSNVESGAYASASDMLREALTRIADDDRQEQALLAALDAGLASTRAKAGVWDRVDAKVRRGRPRKRASRERNRRTASDDVSPRHAESGQSSAARSRSKSR